MKLPYTEVKRYPEVKSQTGLSSLRVSCKRALNDSFYFLSDIPRLFRYLRHLLILSKKLNYEILKSKSAKSSSHIIHNVVNNVTCVVLLSRLPCLIFHSLRHLSIKAKLLSVLKAPAFFYKKNLKNLTKTE